MKNITQANATDTVKSSFERIDNPRMRLLVNRLVTTCMPMRKTLGSRMPSGVTALRFCIARPASPRHRAANLP